MTKIRKSAERDSRLSVGQIIFCTVSLCVLVLTFIESETVISSMSDGMRLCTSTLIPALFPFMVLSEILVSSGAAELISRIIGGLFSKLFGIRREGAIAFLLGIVCGFPIGAKSACSLYQSKRISRPELEHLLCFCNGPSSAFIISAVGVSLFGSRELGILLYAADILSATVIGIGARVFFSGKDKERLVDTDLKRTPEAPSSPIKSVVGAVSSSARAMLYICAFVTFFSAIIGIIRSYAQALSMRGTPLSLLLGFFEMTSGVSAASSLPCLSAALCAAAIIGWSGLSVHFQLISLFGDVKISFRPYFLAKALRSALNVIFVALGMMLLEGKISLAPSSSPSFIYSHSPHPVHILSLSVFFISAILLLKKK